MATKKTAKVGKFQPYDQVNVITPSHSGIFTVVEVREDGVVLSDPAHPGVTFRVAASEILVGWRPFWHR